MQTTNTRLNDDFFIISPDGGSLKKIYKVCEQLNFKGEIITCLKKRDTNSGKLSNVIIPKDDFGGKICIIIDDICSKGGTFMGLAEELKKRNAGKIYLIVSHYENSADIEKLKASGIEKVFTTPSIGKVEKEPNYGDFVKVIPFGEFIEFIELGIA
jgi:ribose-phosphate pyrophosphokinase